MGARDGYGVGVKRVFRLRVLEPLKQQLSQGATPGKLAFALALGLVIGSLPLLFITSLICGVVAYVLRLNQPAIQVANYAAYPLQLALFVPFFKAGAHFFGSELGEFSLERLKDELSADVTGTMGRYATANLHAISAWALVAPVAVLVVFVVLRVVLARVRLPS